jgi:hypothetical protein
LIAETGALSLRSIFSFDLIEQRRREPGEIVHGQLQFVADPDPARPSPGRI